jgi:hypothetical protein
VLEGLPDLLKLLDDDPVGPWIGNTVVNAFVDAHGLMVGDLIDICDDEGVVQRLGVCTGGLLRSWLRGYVASSDSLADSVLVCDCHAPKAKPELTAGKDLTIFIGKFVKSAFRGVDADDQERIEHMWIEVVSVQNEKFHGRLSNRPKWLHRPPLKFGDEVVVEPATIEDVFTRASN